MILVTGATGLVGGNLMWHLLQQNERVVAIRRSTSKLQPLHSIFSFYTQHPEESLSRIDWRIADVLDTDSLLTALEDISVVYHCAAVVSFGDSANIMLDTNVLGTRNVVDAALQTGVRKFCFVSSIAACGREKDNAPIDENSAWYENPNRSPYSRSKYDSEQEVWRGIAKGLNAVIVNPGVILGVSENNSGSAQLFTQVQKGLLFYTNGGTGYVDVQDVVRAMVQLTNSSISDERFVLISENCSNKDILSWMADGFGKRRPFIAVGRTALYTIGYLSEIIGRLFHFKPVIDRATARTATNRQYYSSAKIQKAFEFEFTPIEKCIGAVCKFMQTKH
jgi:dihydroflavonol-4-reductase